MHVLVSGRHAGAHPDGHQHGVSDTNLYKFGEEMNSPHILLKKIAVSWTLARVLEYLPFYFSQILAGLYLVNGFFLFWSILNGVTLKTSSRSNKVILWILK